MDVLDVNIKQYIIDNGIQKEVNRLSKKEYIALNMGKEYIDIVNKDREELINKISYPVFRCALNINNAFYHRKSRVKDRVSAMLKCGKCLFITLTFTDIVLNQTTYDKRRRYVREFLKEYSNYYIANIDFGDKNGREHYHAIILCDYIDSKDWKYGFSKINTIVNNSKSAEITSKYVTKLSSHAIKKSTGRNFPLIYGRKVKELVLQLERKEVSSNEN